MKTLETQFTEAVSNIAQNNMINIIKTLSNKYKQISPETSDFDAAYSSFRIFRLLKQCGYLDSLNGVKS